MTCMYCRRHLGPPGTAHRCMGGKFFTVDTSALNGLTPQNEISLPKEGKERMASRYSIIIDIHEGGDITANIEGDEPLDLRRSDSWDDAQRSAADLWIGLGLPRTTLETEEPEGSS